MRRALCVLALLLAAPPSLSAAEAGPSRPRESRPNIILILADDLGAKELSCYGSTRHQTPQLDRMAAEGARFETFYVNPLCTPTRVALMTGQYGFHNGFLGMQDPAFKPAPGSPQASIGNHFTHADLLKSCGYATALVGKWQLSGELPTLIYDAGFDEYRMWAYDRNWIYSHLDDGRVLRDERWLLEIAKGGKGEKFFDCGESRDGDGYKDVSESADPEVKAARARFAAVLAALPEPKPRDGTTPQPDKKKQQRKKRAGNE